MCVCVCACACACACVDKSLSDCRELGTKGQGQFYCSGNNMGTITQKGSDKQTNSSVSWFVETCLCIVQSLCVCVCVCVCAAALLSDQGGTGWFSGELLNYQGVHCFWSIQI